jgi:hypothetical protein
VNTLTALLLFSLTAPHFAQPVRPEVATAIAAKPAHKGGRWYLAQTGHAVYCYGPVRFVTQPTGGLQRVATYCQGGEVIVPLHD